MKLIDSNLLIYSASRGVPEFAKANAFVTETLNSGEPIALPWVTILAFVRTVTRRSASERPMPLELACDTVDGWLARPNVVALEPGPEHWRILRELLQATGATGNLTTDAHLAALAIENGAELCSADTDFARFPQLRWTNPLRAS